MGEGEVGLGGEGGWGGFWGDEEGGLFGWGGEGGGGEWGEGGGRGGGGGGGGGRGGGGGGGGGRGGGGGGGGEGGASSISKQFLELFALLLIHLGARAPIPYVQDVILNLCHPFIIVTTETTDYSTFYHYQSFHTCCLHLHTFLVNYFMEKNHKKRIRKKRFQ